MNQGMYGEPYFHDQHIHATHSYTRKFCGCMSLQGGGILACLIWMGINLYVAILSFQERSPVFSHQQVNALMVTGAICILFLVAALFAMFALITNKPAILRLAHRTMWVVVFIFVINFFINIILFGVHRPTFKTWCVDNSRNQLDNISSNNDTETNTDPDDTSGNIYNCDKLWEDELKFAIVLFVMITICYLYWALCLWSYTQKQIYYLTMELYGGGFVGPGGVGPGGVGPGGVGPGGVGPGGVGHPGVAGAGGMPPPPATMMNLKPSTTKQEREMIIDNNPEMTGRSKLLSSLFSRIPFGKK